MAVLFIQKKHTTKGNFLLQPKAKFAVSSGFDTWKREGNWLSKTIFTFFRVSVLVWQLNYFEWSSIVTISEAYLPSKIRHSLAVLCIFCFSIKNSNWYFRVSLQLLVTRSFYRKYVHHQSICTSEGSKHTHTILEYAKARATLDGCELILTLC